MDHSLHKLWQDAEAARLRVWELLLETNGRPSPSVFDALAVHSATAAAWFAAFSRECREEARS